MRIGNYVQFSYANESKFKKPSFNAGYWDSSRTIIKKMQDLKEVGKINDQIAQLENKLTHLKSNPETPQTVLEGVQKELNNLKESWRNLYYGYFQRDGG